MPGPARFADLEGWLEWQQTLHPESIALGLDRVERVLARTGWRAPRCPVITVGGTNGKGSCVAMLDAMLVAAGHRVATFTSPHLVDYRERIRIGGDDVSATSLIVTFERLADALGSDTLTFFEFNTLAALLVFETAMPDAIVLEVGMGGRLDAVNVVDADAAIVASIALDHTEWLGNDLESIAYEKAGIFRPGKAAVYGGRWRSAALEAHALRIGAHLKRREIEFTVVAAGSDAWQFEDAHWQLADLPRPALSGDNQVDNAACVLAVLSEIATQLEVGRDAVIEGLRTAFVPGRFQRIRALDREWILDVAHNPDAARVLAAQLRLVRDAGRTVAVCAMLADKDVEAVISELRDVVGGWYAAGTTGARGLTATELAVRAALSGVVMQKSDDLASAMRDAMAATTRHDRIVVFGSFHTVGPAFEWLRAQTRARDRWLRSV